MVVSGALVWCQRGGQLLPLRLDSIRLSGALTEAHWDAVTHFLDLVASQRLVIQDEGMSIQSTPQSPVTDGIPKFSDNFANLIQEQKCAEKYSLSDCDGTTAKGGLAGVPKVREYSSEEEMSWPKEKQKLHLEITEKDVQQSNLNNEAEIINNKLLRNVVGKAHEVVLDSERNGKQDLVQKFGIFNHDEGWRPETCEDTHKVATVSKCGQQQRRRKIGHVTEPLNLHYMLQQLKQQVSRTEEVVAVLYCQECEQTRHMSSEKGDIAPRASDLQCKQVPSETVADVNCNLCGVRKVLLGVDQNCGVESLCRVVDCQNQPKGLHWTVNDNSSSESFIDDLCSCQEELSKCYPQWQIIEREPSGCASERVRQSYTCHVSGMSYVNGPKQGIPSQSIGQCCSCVSQSNGRNIGDLPSAQEFAGNLHIRNQHQQVFADCERCEFELLSRALVEGPDSDEGMKHILTQSQTPGQDVMSVCYRGLLEQELSKVENHQNSFQIPEVSTLFQNCQPQCNLCDIQSYYHNAYLVNNSLQSQIVSRDRTFNDEQKNQSFHQSVHFPHINQHDSEQQMLMGYGWDQRMSSTSAPFSARRLPECQAKSSICHSRILRSGTPLNGPSQTKDQVNAPIWQRCVFQKRNLQTGTPKRNEMCVKCLEDTMRCHEGELQTQRKSPEGGEGIDCQQCELEKRVFQMGTPEGTKMLYNWQEYTLGGPECELQKQIIQGTGFRQCEFGKRVSPNVSLERNRVCFRCEDSPLEKQVVTPEVDQVSGCRQGVAAPSAEDKFGAESWSEEATSQCNQERTSSWESFRRQHSEGLEEGVHHKKKRSVALWQKLLRKHVISNVRRKPISVALPSLSSASEP
jgi:hypothetical protein